MYTLKKNSRLIHSHREQAHSHKGSGYIHKIRSAPPEMDASAVRQRHSPW